MGLLKNIKEDAEKNRTKLQNSEERDLEQKLNSLFYLDKNIDKELRFLNSVMTRGQDTSERRGLHASAIIVSDDKFCYRQQILSLYYKQLQGEQLPSNLKRIFSEGDAIHEKWQRLFIRGGLADPLELDMTQFNEKYDLSFTPDIICEIDGERMIGEIKSMNTFSYKKQEEHASGKKQLQLYMFLTGIHKGFTLCEDKNTQEFKVRVYDFDYEQNKKYIDRLENIQKYKRRLENKNRLVKRHDKCTGYTCKMATQCPMKDVCYGRSKERL
jgi:hypothetical protein